MFRLGCRTLRVSSRGSILHSRITPSLRFRFQSRSFQHLAKESLKPTTTEAKPPAKPAISEDVVHISQAEQRRRDWNIVKRLSGNLWPKNDWDTKARVVLGVGLLVSGKVRYHLYCQLCDCELLYLRSS